MNSTFGAHRPWPTHKSRAAASRAQTLHLSRVRRRERRRGLQPALATVLLPSRQQAA